MGINERSWYGRALAAGMTILDIVDLKESLQTHNEIKLELGSMPFKIDHFEIAWDQAKTNYQDTILKVESGALAKELVAKSLEQAKEEPDPEILEEGTNFHKLLEFLTADSNNPAKPSMPSEQEIMNWLDIDQEQAQKLIARTKAVLDAPELKRYLTSGQWIQAWNELDIVSEEGKSYRMDRLVELDDHLAIIDYKLTIPGIGTEKYEKYRKQLRNYQAELGRIRGDKPSKAYLISAEGKIHQIS
jgi:ATP-dependent helicase/nuclease subunit A